MIPWQLRETTSNRKLGPHTSVVTLGRQSCPDQCPLKREGCYADFGPLRLHWDRVTDGSHAHGEGFDTLAASLLEWNRTHSHSLIRIGDAGQITESDGRLPSSVLSALTYLQLKGNRAIVYVHPGPETNENLIGIMQLSLVAINVSRHGLNVAHNPDVPQVTTVPKGTFTEGRRKVGDIVQCPAEYREGVTCNTCRLCAVPQRLCVVGFTAHGSSAKKVEAISR